MAIPMLVVGSFAALIAGCASGGGADRDSGGSGGADTGTGPAVDSGSDGGSTDGGPTDGGPIASGPTSHDLVAEGHVSQSSRYRLVSATLPAAGPVAPSSSRYVLRENVIGRIGGP